MTLTGRENGRLVHDGSLVDLLVNGDGGVYGLVGVGLSLDNGSDVLVAEGGEKRGRTEISERE